MKLLTSIFCRGFVFETSTSESEGAILVLPQGAYRKNLGTGMNNYLTSAVVEAWYTYAIKVRGCGVQNGDIRLVYGCDKATSWGTATFSDTMGHPTSLKFGMKEDMPYHTYRWVCNGTTNVQTRVGLSMDKNGDGMVKNQCVFLRTMNPRFSEENWRNIQNSAVQVGLDSPMETLDGTYANGTLNNTLPVTRSSELGNLNKGAVSTPVSLVPSHQIDCTLD